MKALFAFLAAVALAAPVAAQQQQCGPYTEALTGLAADYNERPVAEFDHISGVRIVVFVSADKSTVTVLSVRGEPGAEIACVVAAGENFRQPLPVKAPGQGA